MLTSELEQQRYSRLALGTVLLQQEPAISYCSGQQSERQSLGLRSVLGVLGAGGEK